MAHATFCGPVTYSTLSRMSVVVSKLPSVPVWNVHWGCSRCTFSGVSCASGLNRWFE
jgi:hypothetical protein